MAVALEICTRGGVLRELCGKLKSNPFVTRSEVPSVFEEVHAAGAILFDAFWQQLIDDAMAGLAYTTDPGVEMVLDWQDGDKGVGTALCNHYINMVRDIVGKIGFFGSYEEADCIQEGILGVIKGANEYDITRRTKFSTYVWYEIHEAIVLALRRYARTIRLPHNKEELYRKIRKAERLLMAPNGKRPTSSQLAKKASEGLKKPINSTQVEDVEWTFGFREHVASMEADPGDDEADLHSAIPDEQALCPAEAVISRDLLRSIQEGISELSPREASLMILHYGLGDDIQRGLVEVGRNLGIGRTRVGRLRDESLEQLRETLSSKGFTGQELIASTEKYL
ncbi:sigma-70 family RNA polymerase sigma factor [candidate division WS5 bacterium]|uniref:Sigma-70 family RNA polymerase sigma factor n=1 Tax=candidate division WS5 bacterium TaxID=2093353 RepID=A0A419DCP2_9BACT|nr:MAG: sigma-70 family RNA polymerase sigma factor [candidate division WS5 bacterium]